ncbi:potassium transporter Kup [Polyangium aurulentum]|uniref:potassium transporter Kup n=1 Tax=Polyangium aurulentum TaxID=2567896 RepID=UPI0010ADA71E|nr:potassium transporter Kup [Polyangium aurulentum]UQA56728.1 potassium transporter Kup [Polyangium aurulentum]
MSGTTAEGAQPGANADQGHGHGHGHGGAVGTLVIAALGIVFGDIGTSPLYALKECVALPHGVAATHENILGLLSLFFWSLTMVVTFKYLTFIMRADNGGEGGILALLALVPENLRPKHKDRIGWITAVVIFGAALLYGDGVITPAISVLSAVEGLEVATTSLKPIVVPLTCIILLGLFAVQSRGTAGIGRVFGPVMVLWFLVLAGLGVVYIARYPAVLAALNPAHAARFFAHHGGHGFAILGSVVLCVTGGEALYADMGHFGRRPITLAWYGAVMPALVLNYFGQGALLLAHPEQADHPFFSMVPKGAATYALVALAASATVIASQALISGAFSLTRQATQLGFLPRVRVKHTSHETEGQIYVPEVNWLLCAACLVLVFAFRESGRLAAAYGIAVTGTMGITSIIFYVVARRTWGWPVHKALPLLLLFLVFDFAFFGANLLKFFDGGYVPMLIGVALFVAMVIWRRGRAILDEKFRKKVVPFGDFRAALAGKPVTHGPFRGKEHEPTARVPGTAVFLTSNAEEAPPVLTHHVRHNKSLHRTVLIVTVTAERAPRVSESKRVEVQSLGEDFHRVVIRSGYMQDTHLPRLLEHAAHLHAIPFDPGDVTYYLGRETLLATSKGEMGRLPETIFSFMAKNASSASAHFHLPEEHVVELGIQVDL